MSRLAGLAADLGWIYLGRLMKSFGSSCFRTGLALCTVVLWLLLGMSPAAVAEQAKCGTCKAQEEPDTEDAFYQQLQGWLDRPAVQLVIVEFYNKACKICRDHSKDWQTLVDRYKAEGFEIMFVVIDGDPFKVPEGKGCPGRFEWKPDASFCSEPLADALGIEWYPSTYIWDWTGEHLLDGRFEGAETFTESKNEIAKYRCLGISAYRFWGVRGSYYLFGHFESSELEYS